MKPEPSCKKALRPLKTIPAIATLMALPMIVLAQTLEKTIDVNLAAQPVSTALIALSKQAGIQIVMPGNALDRYNTRGLHGRVVLREALNALLQGTGLRFHEAGERTIDIDVVKPKASSSSVPQATPDTGDVGNTLDTVVVTGVAEGFSATRSNTPLKEIPQSVSVISRETLDQQNAVDLPTALAQATGITLVQNNSQQTYIYSRGFAIDSIHIDGGAPLAITAGSIDVTSRELAEFESIEVLRGSDGLFGGMGSPGASVSLIRKQPTQTPQAQFEASMGSWNQYRLVGDVSGPLNSSDTLGGRLVATATDQDYFYDIANQRKRTLYGILKYEPSPSMALELGGSYERTRGINAFSGLPFYDTGADPHLPRSLALTAPWARDETSFMEAFAKLDHHFNDDWRLKINTSVLKQDMPSFTLATYYGPIDSATGLLGSSLHPVYGPLQDKQSMLDATLTGSFDWLGQKQEVMIGGDYQHQITRTRTFKPNPSDLLIDPLAFDPRLYPAPDFFSDDLIYEASGSFKTIQSGIYGAARFRPFDNLSLLAGGRLSDYRSSEYFTTISQGQPLPTYINDFEDSGKFTPYAGITYNIGSHYTLYTSYVDIYRTNQGVVDKQLKPLPPSDGVNIEAGIKGSWYSNTLNASLAFFKIDQSGVAALDPSVPPNNVCCYITGSIKNKGLDVELTGAIAPNWQMTVGYTYGINQANNAYYTATFPKHLLKLWTNYQLPIGAGRWSVGGGVRAQSVNRVAECVAYDDDNNCSGFIQIHQGSYPVADVRVAYKLNEHWSVSLNLNNIFDRTYYQTLNSLEYGNWYGAPRNFLFKVVGKL